MSDIHLDLERGKIVLRTDYSPDVPAACKSVPGYSFDPKRKAWVYPLKWQVCLDIRQNIANELGREIAFGEEMNDWAKAEKRRQREISALKGGQELPEGQDILGVKERNPKIYAATEGRPFQKVGIAFGAKTRRIILADEPGLGKTVQTLGIVEETGLSGPILVVCNTSAQQVTWPNEIEQWTDDEYLIFDRTIPANVRDDSIREVFEDCAATPGLRVWVIMNPYWVRMKSELDEYGKYIRTEKGVKIIKAEVPALFTSGPWAGVIADESQETLACKTGNAKKWSQQRIGMGALPIAENGLRISLSGTPMRGRPENMFGQLHWVHPEAYGSYWQWAGRHFEVTSDGYRDSKVIGELRDEKRFYDECADYMLRRSKSDVAKDLPPKQYGGTRLDPKDPESLVGIWLPLLPEQKKFYNDLIDGKIVDPEAQLELTPLGLLAEMTRMKQYASTSGDLITEQRPMFEKETDMETGREVFRIDPETDKRIPLYDKDGNRMFEDVVTVKPRLPSNKFNWLMEFLKERDLVGKGNKGKGKIIVASQFRKVIDLFRQELAANYCESFAITGDTKIKDRRWQQDEFQKNPDSPKVFFLQSVAGGTSLTLDQADDVVILDEMWDEGVQNQIEDRAHRLSRTDHNVTIWYLRSRDTIEETMGNTIEQRRMIVRGIMDGTRGVDIKKLMKGE